MKFAPKRDRWMSAVMWTTTLLVAFVGVLPFLDASKGIVGKSIVFVFCFGFALFCVWLWAGVSYSLNESELTVRVGPFAKSIPYGKITKVRPIRSVLSAPSATSVERLEIFFGRFDSIHVTPLDREAFLTELKKRCPHASIVAHDGGEGA